MYVLATYLALVLLATPLHATIPIFILYAMLSAGAVIALSTAVPRIDEQKLKPLALVIPLTLIAVTRLIPFMRAGWSGLGADMGAYYGNLNACFTSFAGCAGYSIALVAYPSHAMGIGTQTILIAFHLAATVAIGAGVHALAKDRFGAHGAFWSLMVYALSLPQFLFYWSFFLKMEIGIAFSLFAMHAYGSSRKRGFVYAGLAGAVHPLTAIPLALTLVGVGIADNKKRYAFGSAAAALAGIAALHAKEIISYGTYAVRYAERSYALAEAGFLAGHFVGFSFYHDALMLFYVPFALLAAAWCIEQKKMPVIGWYALSNLALVSINTAFHNRFIVMFDISCVILSGYALTTLYDRQKNFFLKNALICVIIILTGYTLYQSARMEPLVNAEEFEEITTLQGKYGDTPIFVNNEIYRAFVAGYTGHPTLFSPFNDEPWKSIETPSLIYNARRSTPIRPENDNQFTHISERFLYYIPSNPAKKL